MILELVQRATPLLVGIVFVLEFKLHVALFFEAKPLRQMIGHAVLGANCHVMVQTKWLSRYLFPVDPRVLMLTLPCISSIKQVSASKTITSSNFLIQSLILKVLTDPEKLSVLIESLRRD